MTKHCRNSNDPDELPTMMRALRDWELTCDNLILSPHFSAGWRVPAFSVVYKFYWTDACHEFFKTQKELYPNKGGELWDALLSDSLKVIDLWQKMFVCFVAPQNIAMPKCLWYHRYFFLWVREKPDEWASFFQGSSFNSMGIYTPLNSHNNEAAVGLSSTVRYHFTVDSPLTVDLENQETTCEDQTLSSGFVTQS